MTEVFPHDPIGFNPMGVSTMIEIRWNAWNQVIQVKPSGTGSLDQGGVGDTVPGGVQGMWICGTEWLSLVD